MGNESISKQLATLDLSGLPELSNREFASLALQDLDYEAQLAAIRNVLNKQEMARDEHNTRIDEAKTYAETTKGLRNEHAVSEWIERLQESVYEESARSMAAVGMIAPFVESLFFQGFTGIRDHFYRDEIEDGQHSRWRSSAEDRWDCHYVWNGGRRNTNLVEGVLQLAEAINLLPKLPDDLRPMLQALFEYRNKMFHFGFEWPIEERRSFDDRIRKSNWPTEWFNIALTSDGPWVFYMSPVFISHCLERIDEVIDGVGAYCKDMMPKV